MSELTPTSSLLRTLARLAPPVARYGHEWVLSTGLQQFRAPFGGTAFHLLMAASLVTIIPPVILYFVAQRYFIQGIVVSGVKG